MLYCHCSIAQTHLHQLVLKSCGTNPNPKKHFLFAHTYNIAVMVHFFTVLITYISLEVILMSLNLNLLNCIISIQIFRLKIKDMDYFTYNTYNIIQWIWCSSSWWFSACWRACWCFCGSYTWWGSSSWRPCWGFCGSYSQCWSSCWRACYCFCRSSCWISYKEYFCIINFLQMRFQFIWELNKVPSK